jgi:hypothetical protein
MRYNLQNLDALGHRPEVDHVHLMLENLQILEQVWKSGTPKQFWSRKNNSGSKQKTT